MKKWLISLSSIMLIASLTACAPNAGPAPQNQNQAQTQSVQPTNDVGRNGSTFNPAGTTGPGSTAQNMAGYPNTTNGLARQDGVAFNYHIADRVARAADSVPGVDRAVAVVNGNDALVGIQTRTTGNDMRQRQVIEQQVHSAVKTVAPGHRVRVTSDANLYSRIQTLDTTSRGQYGTMTGANPFTSGPNTVAQNVGNMGRDFAALVRDMGRAVTAPFR